MDKSNIYRSTTSPAAKNVAGLVCLSYIVKQCQKNSGDGQACQPYAVKEAETLGPVGLVACGLSMPSPLLLNPQYTPQGALAIAARIVRRFCQMRRVGNSRRCRSNESVGVSCGIVGNYRADGVRNTHDQSVAHAKCPLAIAHS